MNSKRTTITIGIPTYEAGHSLVVTLQSLYTQTAFKSINKILLAVDGKRISQSILKEIASPKLEIHTFHKRKGQSARINDLCRLAKTDYLILTNDDIVVKSNAIEEILKKIDIPVDLLGCQVDTLPSKSLLQKIINIGKELNMKIAKKWNNGNNYLHCNGRLMVLSKRLYTSITIPELIWNNDAYVFVFNNLQKWKFSHAKKAVGFYQTPRTIAEHIKQSTKFQQSYVENQFHFTKKISQYYAVPLAAIYRSFIEQFLETPLLFVGYVLVFLYSRATKKVTVSKIQTRGYWDTDKSTKEIQLF